MDWRLDPNAYTIGEMAERLRQFIFEGKAAVCETETNIQLRVCGYSAGRPLAEIWEVNLTQHACPPPRCIMGKGGFVLWDGQYEAPNRLVLGTGFDMGGASVRHGIPAQEAPALQPNLVGSVRDRATQYSRDSVGRNLSSGLENRKRCGGSAKLTKAATIGGDMLAVEGTDTEEVAKLIVTATESARRHEASKAAHTSYPSLDPAMALFQAIV